MRVHEEVFVLDISSMDPQTAHSTTCKFYKTRISRLILTDSIMFYKIE